MLQKCIAGEEGTINKSSGGRTVVVGLKLDSPSKELLTWTLVQVAQPGDTVIALHVIRDFEIIDRDGRSSLLSFFKAFDSVLDVYEGFCNSKQVDLKLKICRGWSTRTILVKEAKSYLATDVIVGVSSKHHKIRSSTSLAKYCAKKLSRRCCVVAVDNGKIVYKREASPPNGNVSVISSKENSVVKMMSSDEFTKRNGPALRSSEGVDSLGDDVDKLPGWPLLHVPVLKDRREFSRMKKLSVVQWAMQLPSRNTSFIDRESESESEAIAAVDSDCSSKTLPKELEGVKEKYSMTCRLFEYQELITATSNFLPDNLIGIGGSSRVYRGILPDGKQVAVKILKQTEDALNDFVLEIEIITALDHKNIISFLGFCIEDNNLLLIYNFLSRGSLQENLHGDKKDPHEFGWSERFKVAVGIAKALDYLHNGSAQPVIHRDVKSSNILLSNDFEPQLSDFGLAKWASISSARITCSDVAGTFGYLAPEYIMYGKINDKIDVYAFGVILLELLSGRKPISTDKPKGQESLIMWAKPILKDRKIRDLLDPSLADKYDHDQTERMALAATLCIRSSPLLRPQISLILKLLEGEEDDVLSWARQQVNDWEGSEEESFRRSNIQSYLNLALLDVEEEEEDSVSNSSTNSSTEQRFSLEDYLRGRWSRSSSIENTTLNSSRVESSFNCI